MKIHELAKSLEMDSKELLEKVQSMGIEAKSHMSTLTDIDATAVKNTVQRNKKGAETKIVKVAPKKAEKEQLQNEPRVTVKAANIKPPVQPKTAKSPQDKPQERGAVRKPPVGKPVISKDLEGRPKPPIGKPVVSKEIEERNGNKPSGEIHVEPKQAQTQAPEVKAPVTEEKPAAEKRPPVRKEGEAAAQKTSEGNRPQRTNSDRPQRTSSDRPQRTNSDRPQRTNSDRPQRTSSDRPQRTSSDRPQRPNSDRPQRPNSDRPQRKPGDRPAGKDGNKPNYANRRDGSRPPRRDDGKPAGTAPKKDDKPTIGMEKPTHKRVDKSKTKEKERDKFAKIEKGGAKKNVKPARSLEKQSRPKRHNKPKPIVEPEVVVEALPVGTKIVNVPITVAGLAEQIQISVSKIIMTLMKMGVMANLNQNIDEDTVVLLAAELGVNVVIGKVEEDQVEEGLEIFDDKEEDLTTRPPIITVMGHVDHGKTSLLDAIRKTNVTASESGGITQHIGASEVEINGQKIVFLDTPGHEAFTAMRARGAHTTDIAVLVVAADDSVKPQTIESISHAKAAGVPIIVAINKIDKPGANPDRVKQDLTEHGILVEEWGGDVISVPVSAKSGDGIVTLLEMILLQAEVLELKANPNRLAIGTVIEARLDKAKGPVASLLVLNGTLKSGMSIVAGTCSGKIRLMTNHKGEKIRAAGPATAVEILGLTEVPHAGDEFNGLKEDRLARDIAEQRQQKQREEVLARNSSSTLEELFSQIKEGEVKELGLIIKGDVQGSVGAIVSSLEKLNDENVKVKILHTGVGGVTESDVMLAGTSGAIIIGFNVRPNVAATAMADRDSIQIRTYRVIYDIIDDVENAMKGMLDPVFKEVVLGTVEIRTTFKVPGAGVIGGAYVTSGKVVRNAEIRLVRDSIVIHEGKISSLKRFKDDAKEVAQGFECGIGIENYNDIKEGDIIECFQMEEIKRD